MTTTIDPTMIAARLHRLEDRVRRLHRLVAVLALLPLALAGFAMTSRAPVIRAERLELTGPGDATQAVLRADTAGAQLVLFDAKGRARSAVRLSADTVLQVLDGSGSVVATLGGPRVRHLGE